MTKPSLCTCSHQLQPHDRIAGICPGTGRFIEGAGIGVIERVAVEWPIGDYHTAYHTPSLLVDPDLEDDRGR